MSGLWRGLLGLSGGVGLSVGASGLWDGASGFEGGDGGSEPPPEGNGAPLGLLLALTYEV